MPTVCGTVLSLGVLLAWRLGGEAHRSPRLGLCPLALRNSFGTTDPFRVVAAPSYGATATLTLGMNDHAEAEELLCKSFALANLCPEPP